MHNCTGFDVILALALQFPLSVERPMRRGKKLTCTESALDAMKNRASEQAWVDLIEIPALNEREPGGDRQVRGSFDPCTRRRKAVTEWGDAPNPSHGSMGCLRPNGLLVNSRRTIAPTPVIEKCALKRRAHSPKF